MKSPEAIRAEIDRLREIKQLRKNSVQEFLGVKVRLAGFEGAIAALEWVLAPEQTTAEQEKETRM